MRRLRDLWVKVQEHHCGGTCQENENAELCEVDNVASKHLSPAHITYNNILVIQRYRSPANTYRRRISMIITHYYSDVHVAAETAGIGTCIADGYCSIGNIPSNVASNVASNIASNGYHRWRHTIGGAADRRGHTHCESGCKSERPQYYKLCTGITDGISVVRIWTYRYSE